MLSASCKALLHASLHTSCTHFAAFRARLAPDRNLGETAVAWSWSRGGALCAPPHKAPREWRGACADGSLGVLPRAVLASPGLLGPAQRSPSRDADCGRHLL